MFANIQSGEGAGLCSMISGALPGEHQDAGGAQATEQGPGLNCLLLGCECWMALALSELIRGHTSPEVSLGSRLPARQVPRGVFCNTCLYGHGSLEAPSQCRQAHVVLQSSSVLVEQMSIPETKVICSPELKQIVSLDSCPWPPPAPAMAGLERWLSTT